MDEAFFEAELFEIDGFDRALDEPQVTLGRRIALSSASMTAMSAAVIEDPP